MKFSNKFVMVVLTVVMAVGVITTWAVAHGGGVFPGIIHACGVGTVHHYSAKAIPTLTYAIGSWWAMPTLLLLHLPATLRTSARHIAVQVVAACLAMAGRRPAVAVPEDSSGAG